MTLKNIVYLFLLMLVLGCSSNKDTQKEKKCGECSSCSQTGATLKLNNGNKWKVDDHTRSIITNMQNIVTNQKKPIAKNLKNEIQALIQGCTMKGESHDQLHVFLTKYIPAVENLALNNNEQNLKKIKGLLILYSEYFE